MVNFSDYGLECKFQQRCVI